MGLVGDVGGVARLLMLSDRPRSPGLPLLIVTIAVDDDSEKGVIVGFFPPSSSPFRSVAGDVDVRDCGESLPHTLPIVSRRQRIYRGPRARDSFVCALGASQQSLKRKMFHHEEAQVPAKRIVITGWFRLVIYTGAAGNWTMD